MVEKTFILALPSCGSELCTRVALVDFAPFFWLPGNFVGKIDLNYRQDERLSQDIHLI